MNLILLCLLISAITLLQIHTINGKSLGAGQEVKRKNESDHNKDQLPIIIENNNSNNEKTNDARFRRNSYNNINDENDFLINQLSREHDIMTSNLLDSTATCNK